MELKWQNDGLMTKLITEWSNDRKRLNNGHYMANKKANLFCIKVCSLKHILCFLIIKQHICNNTLKQPDGDLGEDPRYHVRIDKSGYKSYM